MYDDQPIRPGEAPEATTSEPFDTPAGTTASTGGPTQEAYAYDGTRPAEAGASAPGSGNAGTHYGGPWGPVAGGPAAGVPPAGTGYTGAGYAGTGYAATGYPAAGMPPRASGADAPVPWLAGLLGFIPGVGAMYNGQFAKGLAHLAVFAVLVSLADNVNGIFGLFVAGWVFYQAFEAFHTAQARRDGQPLPNAFGLNDIGERLGFGKNWPGSSSRPVTSAPTGPGAWSDPGSAAPGSAAPGSTQPGTAQGGTAAGYTQGYAAGYTQAEPTSQQAPYVAAQPPVSAAPPLYADASYGSNWAGYIPPAAFASAPQPGMGPVNTGPSVGGPLPGQSAAWNSVPYTTPYAETAAVPSAGQGFMEAMSAGRRFPVGAVLLIGLGGVFLLSNVAPAWHLNDRWLLPLLLAASSVWMFVRRVRVSMTRGVSVRPGVQVGNLVCAIRLPALLLVLAAMFAFQAGGWLTIGQSWPLLLIVLGALLLAERTAGRVAQGSAVSGTSATGSAVPAEDVRAGGGL